MRLRWFATAALALLIAAESSHGAAVDAATAKAVLKTYITAMLAGDDAAVRRLTIQDPEQQKVAMAIARYERALVKVEAASQRRFKTGFANDGTPDAIPTPDPKGVDQAKVETTDSGVTLTLADVKESYRVRQVNGVNLIDLTTDNMKTANDLRLFSQITEPLAIGLTKIADRIDHGDFANVAAAREAFDHTPAATMPTLK